MCTHNPDFGRFERVMKSLENQTNVSSKWELLIVDNASNGGLSGTILEFCEKVNYRVRVCVEIQLGLTNARLKGISEATGSDWILFIDDDNALDQNYLEASQQIINEHPQIGCFGGSLIPEFEVEPKCSMCPYLPALALREIKEAKWSNNYDIATTPYGAGMWVRSDVAEAYYEASLKNSLKRQLDRKGDSLNGSGDTDLAFTACDLGLACGLFPQLRLTHIIPSSRLNLRYLKRLTFGSGYSDILLTSLRFPQKITWRAIIIKTIEICAQPLFYSDKERKRKNTFRLGQFKALLHCLRNRL
jgi:hypothetical protein